MARPREFDPDELLQTAINLFWEKGYFDTSVDEIVRQSGVAKYGVYGTFGSKRDLFKKALQQYALDRHKDMQRPIRQADAALPEIRQFFEKAVELMTDGTIGRGCLMVNTGIELAVRDVEIGKYVTGFFRDIELAMRHCLNNAVALNQIKNASGISSLSTYLVTEFRTALMLAGSGYPKNKIQAHLDIALAVLD